MNLPQTLQIDSQWFAHFYLYIYTYSLHNTVFLFIDFSCLNSAQIFPLCPQITISTTRGFLVGYTGISKAITRVPVYTSPTHVRVKENNRHVSISATFLFLSVGGDKPPILFARVGMLVSKNTRLNYDQVAFEFRRTYRKITARIWLPPTTINCRACSLTTEPPNLLMPHPTRHIAQLLSALWSLFFVSRLARNPHTVRNTVPYSFAFRHAQQLVGMRELEKGSLPLSSWYVSFLQRPALPCAYRLRGTTVPQLDVSFLSLIPRSGSSAILLLFLPAPLSIPSIEVREAKVAI